MIISLTVMCCFCLGYCNNYHLMLEIPDLPIVLQRLFDLVILMLDGLGKVLLNLFMYLIYLQYNYISSSWYYVFLLWEPKQLNNSNMFILR